MHISLQFDDFFWNFSKCHERRKKSRKYVDILAKQCRSQFNLINFLTFQILNAKHRIKFYLLCEVKNGSFEASNCSEFSWRHILLTRRSLTNSWPHGLGGNRFLPTWSWPRMVTVANGSDRLIAASDWFPANRRSLGESPRLSLLTLLAIGARAALPLREHEPWANH